MISLLPASILCIFLSIRRTSTHLKLPLTYRELFCITFIIWYAILVMMTELNHLFGTIHTMGVAISWCSIIVICMIYIKFIFGNEKTVFSKPFNPTLLRKTSLIDAVLITGTFLLISIVFIIALVSAPNNYDSLTQHLSRVIYWIQNQNLHHFATPTIGQVAYPPGVEYGFLHAILLNGNDQFVNLFQWVAWIGNALLASMIAKYFGLNRQMQFFSAIFILTLPTAILEASSTQNDQICSFWLISFVYFVLRLKQSYSLLHCFLAGISLGLAILTKPYAFFYGFPFGLMLVIFLYHHKKLLLWKPLGLFILCILVLNAGIWLRNISAFGAWMPRGLDMFVIETYSLKILFLAWIKNTALHLGTPFEILNTSINQTIAYIHSIMKIDMMDPRLSLTGNQIECCVQEFAANEDFSPNPLHFSLAIIASLLLFLKIKINKQSAFILYLFSITASTTALCWYLKWHPFFTRYHIFYFATIGPALALLFSITNKQTLAKIIAVLLLVASSYWVFFNELRPLLGSNSIFRTPRIQHYFTHNPQTIKGYVKTASFLQKNNLNRIGLIARENDWDYLLWILLSQDKNFSFQMKHIDVAGPTEQLNDDGFKPNAIVSFGIKGLTQGNGIQDLIQKYGKVILVGSLYIFLPDKVGNISIE